MNLTAEFFLDGWQDMAKEMLSRANLPDGYLKRVVVPELINIQMARWMSENTSQADRWTPLKPSYAARKLRKFAAYPGGGRKLLVATGDLKDSMTGRPPYHRNYVERRTLIFGTSLPYAPYVDEKRDITSLTDRQIKDFGRGFAKYIATGKTVK